MKPADIVSLDVWDFWPEERWVNVPAPVLALRCTEGLSDVDSKFEERQKEAEERGIRSICYHVVSDADARTQMGHFQDVAKLSEGSRIILELGENAELSDLRDCIMFWHAWGTQNREITIRGGDRLRELLGDQHDPVLQRADLWILENHDDEPDFPRKTWATWTLRELPQTSNDPPASVFNDDIGDFLEWLG